MKLIDTIKQCASLVSPIRKAIPDEYSHCDLVFYGKNLITPCDDELVVPRLSGCNYVDYKNTITEFLALLFHNYWVIDFNNIGTAIGLGIYLNKGNFILYIDPNLNIYANRKLIEDEIYWFGDYTNTVDRRLRALINNVSVKKHGIIDCDSDTIADKVIVTSNQLYGSFSKDEDLYTTIIKDLCETINRPLEF